MFRALLLEGWWDSFPNGLETSVKSRWIKPGYSLQSQMLKLRNDKDMGPLAPVINIAIISKLDAVKSIERELSIISSLICSNPNIQPIIKTCLGMTIQSG